MPRAMVASKDETTVGEKRKLPSRAAKANVSYIDDAEHVLAESDEGDGSFDETHHDEEEEEEGDSSSDDDTQTTKMQKCAPDIAEDTNKN